MSTIYYGDPADEPEVTAPMFALAEAIYSSVRTIAHVTLQHSTDDEFRYGISHYWKHTALDNFDNDGVDLVLKYVDEYPGRSLNSSAHIAHQLLCPFELIGGTRSPQPRLNDATAGIESLLSVNIGADWQYTSEKHELVDWARRFDKALEPYRHGTYINSTSIAGDEDMARKVYGEKYERLAKVKRQYDPDNVFSRGLVNLAENIDSPGVT